MTHRAEDGTVWIAAEPPGRCEVCGAVRETRPYGRGGQQICHPCAEKDPVETERQMRAFFDGTHPLPPLEKAAP